MKLLLCAMVVLLTVGTAEATVEIVGTIKCETCSSFTIPPGNVNMVMVPEDTFDRLTDKSYCLAKMEAAMKAMEPYLFSGLGVYESHKDFENAVMERWYPYKQWADAKRECWRGMQ